MTVSESKFIIRFRLMFEIFTREVKSRELAVFCFHSYSIHVESDEVRWNNQNYMQIENDYSVNAANMLYDLSGKSMDSDWPIN